MSNLFALFSIGVLAALLVMIRRDRQKLRELVRIRDELAGSEERLRLVIESAPEGILTVDAHTGEVIDANANALRILGRDRDKVASMSLSGMSPDFQPDGRSSSETLSRFLTDAGRRGRPVFEWHFLDPEGRVRPVEVRLITMGHSGPIRASLTDIGEGVRARQVLQESEARFRTLVDHATEAIVLLDVDSMSFTEINAKAAELFRCTREELLGMPPISLFPRTQPNGRPTTVVMEETMQQVLEGKGLVEIELVARRTGGELFNASLRSVLLPGQRPQVRSTIIDVTDRIREQEALLQARDDAERANRAKTGFLAHMSHEIRTPMNGVLGMLDLLIDSDLTRDQRQSAELAKSSAESLLAILNDILDVSKIEAGQFELESVAFDLHATVRSVVGLMAPRGSEKGVEVHSVIDPGVPQYVVGDPLRLRQVLSNLVSNAVKFTRDGEVLVRLGAEGETQTEVGIGFAVRDTGTGIPKDRLESIFDSFVQADASVTRRFGGTGLGLTICRQLVGLMGGDLRVESEPGRGSEFRFSLTLRRATTPVDGGPGRARTDLAGRRVLIVDPSSASRHVILQALAPAGVRVLETTDPYSALRAARIAVAEEDAFAAALLDSSLPEDGVMVFADAVASDANLAGLKLVVFSDDPSVPALPPSRPAPAAVLSRTVSDDELKTCLGRVLGCPVAKGEETGRLGPHRTGLRILVAEDNAVNQRVATAMLTRRGHLVDVVDNGVAAVEAVARNPYDVVLMDVQMPRLDGLGATRQIRQNGYTDLRIIALTAHATTDDRDRCVEAGMDGFLTKPFDPADLYRRVESAPEPAGSTIEAAEVLRTTGSGRSVAAEPDHSAGEEGKGPVDLDGFRATMEAAGVGDIVEETLRSYLEESPDRIQWLAKAMASGDSEEVRKAAHALKSSSAAIGARPLAGFLQQLENAGKAGDLGGAAECLDQVVALHGAVVDQLERTLAVKT